MNFTLDIHSRFEYIENILENLNYLKNVSYDNFKLDVSYTTSKNDDGGTRINLSVSNKSYRFRLAQLSDRHTQQKCLYIRKSIEDGGITCGVSSGVMLSYDNMSHYHLIIFEAKPTRQSRIKRIKRFKSRR